MNMDRRVWRVILIFTLAVSVATAIGNIASSSILGGARLEEAQAKASIERRAKGAQFHCEKLQQAASLAAEIDFRVTRNEGGATSLGSVPGKLKINRTAKADWSEIEQEQRAFEKRTSQLIPFLEKTEALLLEEITLSHDAIMSLQRGGAERPIRLKLAATPEIDTARDSTGVAGASAKLVRVSSEDSVLPQGERPVASGNQGLALLRVNAAELARMYRAKCSEGELASGQ
ncbi:MAG: hypothetical protein V7631_2113 [Massilia sp.]